MELKQKDFYCAVDFYLNFPNTSLIIWVSAAMNGG